MELTFTGRGAMLYPKEGNTAAYFEDENNFYLIDCGEDVASKLIEQGKLTKNKEYYLLITHTHSDHIGSLGTLQQYLYWCCGKKLHIVYSDDMEYMKEVREIIHGFGLVDGTYEMVNVNHLPLSELYNRIRFVPSSHGDVPLKSCSIIINTNEGDILYTGDIANTLVIEYFLRTSSRIDKMYIDTSYNKSAVHLSIQDIRRVIPDNLIDRVYCMHINNEKLIPLIGEYGFNLVAVKKEYNVNEDKKLDKTW